MTCASLVLYPIHVPNKRTGKVHRWAAPPSMNNRLHWGAKAKLTKLWRTAVWAECKRVNAPALPRARIVVTRYAVRDIDEGALREACKPILDGIVDARVVPDDSMHYVKWDVVLVRVKHFDQERITVEISAWEDSAHPPSQTGGAPPG